MTDCNPRVRPQHHVGRPNSGRYRAVCDGCGWRGPGNRTEKQAQRDLADHPTATETDEHRYVIRAPWGDEAEADTYDAALAARRQLGNDARDAGIEWSGWLDSITIIDRGYAPQEG